MELEKIVTLKQLLNFAIEVKQTEIEIEQPVIKTLSSSSTTAELINSYRLDQKQREETKTKGRMSDKKSKPEAEAKPASAPNSLRVDADGFFIYEKKFTAHKYSFIENENMLLLGVFKDKKKSGYPIPEKHPKSSDFDRDHMEYLEQLGQLNVHEERPANNNNPNENLDYEEDLFQEILFSAGETDEFFNEIIEEAPLDPEDIEMNDEFSPDYDMDMKSMKKNSSSHIPTHLHPNCGRLSNLDDKDTDTPLKFIVSHSESTLNFSKVEKRSPQTNIIDECETVKILKRIHKEDEFLLHQASQNLS